MKIELLQGEWQKDYSKIIDERLQRIRKRFDRVYKEDTSRMFAKRFPLNEAVERYEAFHGVSIGKADFLFELSEALEGCEAVAKQATEWVDKWFFYFNMV